MNRLCYTEKDYRNKFMSKYKVGDKIKVLKKEREEHNHITKWINATIAEFHTHHVLFQYKCTRESYRYFEACQLTKKG